MTFLQSQYYVQQSKDLALLRAQTIDEIVQVYFDSDILTARFRDAVEELKCAKRDFHLNGGGGDWPGPTIPCNCAVGGGVPQIVGSP